MPSLPSSKGCSSSELGVIVGVAALVWLPVSLLLAGLMGAVTMGFRVGWHRCRGHGVVTATLSASEAQSPGWLLPAALRHLVA